MRQTPTAPRRIFVTVGAQLPFDRLVEAVDRCIDERNKEEVFAQIGSSKFVPVNMRYVDFLPPEEFRKRLSWADLLVAHAGMGSILSALEFGKPVVVMPRLARLGETRNNHQVGSARRLRELANVTVAMNPKELREILVLGGPVAPPRKISPFASVGLIAAVRDFIKTGNH